MLLTEIFNLIMPISHIYNIFKKTKSISQIVN